MHLFRLTQKRWECPKTCFRFKTNTKKYSSDINQGFRILRRCPTSTSLGFLWTGGCGASTGEVNSAEQDRQYRSGLFIRPSIAVGRVRHSSAACRRFFTRRSLIVRQSHSCRPRHSRHSDARKRWRHADKFANTNSQREIARFYFSAGVGAMKILDFPVAI